MKNFCRLALSISASFVFTGCTQKFEAQPTAPAPLPSDAIIGGYTEDNEKISSQVYRFQLPSSEGRSLCTAVQMEDGSVLTAAHCLDHDGARKEMATFYANEPNSFKTHGIMYPLGSKAAGVDFFANDIAVALTPQVVEQRTTGFKFPSNAEMPEELYISGYGGESFDGETPEGPLKSLKISRSKQELKTITDKNVNSDFKKSRKDIAMINKLLAASQLRCFKTLDKTTHLPFQGDSGGPLYSLDANGSPVLHGVFSIFVGLEDRTDFYCYTNVFPNKQKIQSLQKSSESLLFQNKLDFKTDSGTLQFDSQIFDQVSTASRTFTGELIDVGYGQIHEVLGRDLAGQVALVARGGIPFHEKIENLKSAGAEAIVIYNNTEENHVLYSLVGSSFMNLVDQADIRMISKKDGEVLAQLLKSGKKVEAKLTIGPDPTK